MKMLCPSSNEVICFVLDDFLAACLIDFVTVMACLICIDKAVDQFNLLRWNAVASGQNPILEKHKSWSKISGIFMVFLKSHPVFIYTLLREILSIHLPIFDTPPLWLSWCSQSQAQVSQCALKKKSRLVHGLYLRHPHAQGP